MADIFNTEVVTLKVSEGAAYGAALQALWCWRKQAGEKISIKEISDRFIEVNPEETAQPDPKNVTVYQELQALQDEISENLREVFEKHRSLIIKMENKI
jgi:xylulokinase